VITNKKAMKKLILIPLILFSSITGNALANEILGIKLGMTEKQVTDISTYLNASLVIHSNAGKHASAFLRSNSDQYNILATISFCESRVVSISRSLGISNDLLEKIDENIKKYGNPVVQIISHDWAGGGTIKLIKNTWKSGNFKSDVSIGPEGRNSDGSLKVNQSGHYSIQMPSNNCYNIK
jgi:hypothetical protein